MLFLTSDKVIFPIEMEPISELNTIIIIISEYEKLKTTYQLSLILQVLSKFGRETRRA